VIFENTSIEIGDEVKYIKKPFKWHESNTSFLKLKKEGFAEIYFSMVVFLFMLICIGISQNILKKAHREYSEAMEKFYQVEKNELKTKQQIEANKKLEKLIKEATEIGLNPVQWTELSMNMNRQKMTREATNKLFNQIKRKPDHYFRVEKFELSVEQPDQSLYESGQQNTNVLVSLKGRSIIRSNKSK
jgi:hypothetical protein